MAQPKEEEGIDIMQAKTGLLDLIAVKILELVEQILKKH